MDHACRLAGRYGDAVSEPLITHIVAVEEPPPGSRATHGLIAAGSNGAQAEALARFSDECLVSDAEPIAVTRDQVRALAHRGDRQWLQDEPRPTRGHSSAPSRGQPHADRESCWSCAP